MSAAWGSGGRRCARPRRCPASGVRHGFLGAPHRGFAPAIRETSARISRLTGGRPPVGRPESLVQCARKRRRRHRSTVSGATITRASLHSVHTLDSQTQKSRSLLRSLGRLAVLLYTASCWRRARFSRASCRWPPQRNGQRRSKWSSVLIMEGDCLRIRAERSTACPPDGFWRRTDEIRHPLDGNSRTDSRQRSGHTLKVSVVGVVVGYVRPRL